MRIKTFYLLIIAGLFSVPVYSQTGIFNLYTGDSNREYTGKVEIYELYDGKEYLNYAPSLAKGHPFLIEREFNKGKIVYKGKVYENVPVLYDLVTDQLVLLHYDNFNRIQLFKPYIASFEIEGMQFIHLKEIKSPGFYQLLHQGNITLLAKKKKILKENVEQRKVQREVSDANSFHIMNNGELTEVRRLKTLLNAMGDKRNEVQQWVKKNKKIKNKEILFKAVAAYYDQISDNEN